MRIGLINQLHGRPDGPTPAPTWESLLARAKAAEAAGFDLFVYEDALLYRGEETSNGVWEAGTIGGALAAATDRIEFGPSVINTPYRNPALLAAMAETASEVSGGRFILGLGAGNTDDYDDFGFTANPHYSRFVEAIEIIHGLLRDRSVQFEGDFYQAPNAELVLTGPRPVPIVVACGGPKMMRLAAKYADGWNWWAWGEQPGDIVTSLQPLLNELDNACTEVGRDPASLKRSLDVHAVVAPGHSTDEMDDAITGSAQDIADGLLSLRSIGIDEVRLDVFPKTPEAIEGMIDVVALVHAG